MPRLVIAYFDAGGGHRAAALAIKAMLCSQPEAWGVTLLNLQEHLDALDPLRRLTGMRLQDIYNGLLNRGFTRSMRHLLPLLHATVRLYTPTVATRLSQHWRATKPDMLVSVVPNLNRALALSLKISGRQIPFTTVITDFADTPPHFWIETESEYVVCGTHRAMNQALRMGHPRQRLFATSGMVLNPVFYKDRARESREAIRTRLSLSPHLSTVLVMFGGQGSREMLKIAERLDRCCSPVQVVYICGHNEKLRTQLALRSSRLPGSVVGFTTDVGSYMLASDVMIGKPGPGTISEALHFGLPMIVSCNHRTMPQEVYNTQWVREHGVGAVVPDFRHIDREVDSILNDGRLEKMRTAAAQIRNRAIFEIPEIFRMILGMEPVGDDRAVLQENAGVGAPSTSSTSPVC